MRKVRGRCYVCKAMKTCVAEKPRGDYTADCMITFIADIQRASCRVSRGITSRATSNGNVGFSVAVKAVPCPSVMIRTSNGRRETWSPNWTAGEGLQQTLYMGQLSQSIRLEVARFPDGMSIVIMAVRRVYTALLLWTAFLAQDHTETGEIGKRLQHRFCQLRLVCTISQQR